MNNSAQNVLNMLWELRFEALQSLLNIFWQHYKLHLLDSFLCVSEVGDPKWIPFIVYNSTFSFQVVVLLWLESGFVFN